MSLDLTLTRNYLGIMMPLSPNATNGVTGTAPGQTLVGRRGVSNWIISAGGGSTLIGGDSGDTFYVVDPTDVVIAAANSGINTIISWSPYYALPANVQNLFLQSASGGIGIGNSLDNLLVAEGPSNYTLVAGTGNDVMIGNGSGDPQFDTGAGSTTFVIARGDGNDVISNFRSGIDVVRLDGFTNFANLAAVQAAMTQTGSDVVLNLGNNQTLTFRNETVAGFQASDFMLPAHLTGMTLRFDDEFNNFVWSPDGSQGWMTQGGAYWRTLSSNNELEYYSDSSVGTNPFSDSNGVLTITAAPGSNPLGLPYNSGIITTEGSFNFEYGLVEVSAKLPSGAGLWPAIWLLPSSLGWPPEIDIMEMLGSNPNLIYASTHSGSSNNSSTLQAYVGDTTQSFHTYGLDWEPDHITWYFDGNAIRTVTTPADMHQPMYLLINLAVGGAGSWPGAPTSASEFPAQMQIDYVHIYGSSNTTAVSGTAAQAPGPAVTISGDTAGSAGPVSTGPTISAISTTPASGDLKAGSTVTLTVSFSSPVTVAGGTPTLVLNDGGTATYVSGSGTNALLFSYTVAAGQNTTDLALASSNPVALNGATIQDSAGNNAALTAAAGYSPAGILQIDTTSPSIVSIATSPGSGQVGTGSAVSFTVTFSEAVTVAGGVPTLALNDGASAAYVSGSGSNALVFRYTVAAGQTTPDLALAASNALALNGATIRDGAGNDAVLAGANGFNPSGTLQVNPVALPASVYITPGLGSFADAAGNVYTIDSAGNAMENGQPIPNGSGTAAMEYSSGTVYGQDVATGQWYTWNQSFWAGPVAAPPPPATGTPTPPVISAITTSPGSGDLKANSTVTLTVTFNAPVTVAGGTPTLALNDGGTATYVSGSGSNALVFSYAVVPGQNTADLSLAASNALALNGATIQDSTGTSAALTGANGYNPSGTLKIDTTAPIVAAITTLPGSGQVGFGGTVSFTVTFSEAVTVSGGTPSLTLNDGGSATYASGSGSNALVFSYTVGAGQNTADLALAASNALALNGATIRDGAGNDAVLTAANGYNPAGTLQVDGTVPSILGITMTPGSGDLTIGSSVTLTMTFSTPVTVAGGTPTLTLNDGGSATYVSGSGSNTLKFTYTVAAGQNTADLALAASNAFALNGATIQDSAGNNAALAAANGYNPSGTLQIDTTAPTVAALAMSPATGQVSTGPTVSIAVTFSETVVVAGGMPSLALNDGGTATYVSGSGSDTLVFSYTVTSGQSTSDLALAASNAIALNGATVRDGAGNDAVLTAANGYTPATALQVNTAAQPPVTVQDVTVSDWWNTYDLGSGTFSVSGTAGGADIIMGDGNQTVDVTGIVDTVQTGDGNQTITFLGDNNTVTTGAGTSTINMQGSYETVQVGATPAGTTTAITAAGYGEDVSSTGSGDITFSGSTGNSTVNFGDGNDSITMGGSGNSVTVGTGTTTINAGIGQAVIHAAGGSDTVNVSGWGNLIDAGPGINFLHGGSGNDTFVLNGPGQGMDTIWQFSLTNNDKLDLTRTLGSVAPAVDLTNVGSYLSAVISGNTTTLYVDLTGGHGTPSAIATLEGVATTVAQLVAHDSLIVP